MLSFTFDNAANQPPTSILPPFQIGLL